jgi:hypothetical protein
LKQGFRLAIERGLPFVITMDGDGQHDPCYIPAILKHLRIGARMVICSRFHHASMQIDVPPDRILLNVSVTAMMRRVTGWDLTDAVCGFRGFRQNLLQEMIENLESDEYGLELEMLLRLWDSDPLHQPPEVPHPAIYSNKGGELDRLYAPDRLDERLERFSLHAGHILRTLQSMGKRI